MTVRGRGATHGALQRARRRSAWLFLAPTLLALGLVAGWPLLRTVSLAFTDARLAASEAARFVGLENFLWLLDDPGWWNAVANTLVFAVVSVSLELVLGLAIALLLFARLRGASFLQGLALVPWAVPTIVVGQVWRWIYHDIYGLANEALLALGLVAQPVAWLADPDTALAAVIVADVWKATPFVALLLFAGLQTIPVALLQAVRIDGAGPVRLLFAVILPLLRPAIAVALIFRTLDALRVFDMIYIMTGNSRAAATVSIFARQQLIDFQDAGYGSAASVLVFLLVATVSVAYVALLRPAAGVAR